jgi:hypothetical protein
MAGNIAPLILEANQDAVFMERPKLLDEPVIKFVCPVAGKEFNDGRAPVKKNPSGFASGCPQYKQARLGRVAAVPASSARRIFFIAVARVKGARASGLARAAPAIA